MSRRPAEPPPCLSAPPAALDRPVQPAARSAWARTGVAGVGASASGLRRSARPDLCGPPGSAAPDPFEPARPFAPALARSRPEWLAGGCPPGFVSCAPPCGPRALALGPAPRSALGLRRARPDAGSPCAVRPDCHARSRPHGISAPCSGTHPESRRVLRRWDPRPHPLTCRAAPRDAIPLRRRATAGRRPRAARRELRHAPIVQLPA